MRQSSARALLQPKGLCDGGEQPLPPNGACLLGSFNLTKYLKPSPHFNGLVFDYDTLRDDVWVVVRAMDNVIDRTIYPLVAQEIEAKSKRRMGLGVTGLANTMEILRFPYGTTKSLVFMEDVLRTIRDEAYQASVSLAMEKGPFPLFDHDQYPNGAFIATLPDKIRGAIEAYGIRNSHLLSIAPTGTISLTADNVSSGIEPPYLLEYTRTIQTFDGPRVETVRDYACARYNVRGLTAQDISVRDHLNVQATATYFVDSAVSKTCNVGPTVSFDGFAKLYEDAWSLGCKGLTTFRADGKRFGILNEIKEDPEEPKSEACTFDPVTGTRTCDQ